MHREKTAIFWRDKKNPRERLVMVLKEYLQRGFVGKILEYYFFQNVNTPEDQPCCCELAMLPLCVSRPILKASCEDLLCCRRKGKKLSRTKALPPLEPCKHPNYAPRKLLQTEVLGLVKIFTAREKKMLI